MEIFPSPVKKFLPQFERQEPLARDHSATRVAKDCYRKYFYSMVLGFREKTTPEFFAFGTAYHKFRELLESKPIPEAIEGGLALMPEDPPVGSKYDFLTKARLIKTMERALETWSAEKKLKKVEVIAVEQDFAITTDSGMIISGKIDQILRIGRQYWIRDFKTSSKTDVYYQRGLEPNDQVTRYTWAVSKLISAPVMGAMFEVVFNNKKAGPTIKQFSTSRSPWQFEQWLREQEELEVLLARCRETDIWPMNENNCSYCPFHIVCSQATEQSIAAQLTNHFRVRHWDSAKRETD